MKKTIKSLKNELEFDNCSICLEDMLDLHQVKILHPCQQKYHNLCIKVRYELWKIEYLLWTCRGGCLRWEEDLATLVPCVVKTFLVLCNCWSHICAHLPWDLTMDTGSVRVSCLQHSRQWHGDPARHSILLTLVSSELISLWERVAWCLNTHCDLLILNN